MYNDFSLGNQEELPMAKQERVYIPLPLYHLKQIQYWLAVGIYVLGVEKFSGGGYHWEI